MRTVTITILLKDCHNIDAGQTCDYSHGTICPLARAINKVLKRGYFVRVGSYGSFGIVDEAASGDSISEEVYCYHGQCWVSYSLLALATEDFTREIELPEECLK